MSSSEPERHACEELAAAAANYQVVKDVQLQGTVPKAGSVGDATAAGPQASQSTKTVSSAGGQKKVTHKTPKPGVCLFLCQSYRVG